MVDPLESSPAFRMHRVQRLLRAHLLGMLRPFELTPEQYFVLMRLADEDGRIQGDLGDPSLDDRASVSRQIVLLEQRGLVVRRRHSQDYRAFAVYLTEAGRQLLDALGPSVLRERQRLFGGIDASDLEAFCRVLDQLEAVLTS